MGTLISKRAAIAIFTIALLISNMGHGPAYAADDIQVASTQSYVANIKGAGDVWQGDIPTRLNFPDTTTYSSFDFTLKGLLPADTMNDSIHGVTVQFTLWSQAGKKITSKYLWEDWNPVGPNTIVTMYLGTDAIGSDIMQIETDYNLSSNGLITQYHKTTASIPIQVVLSHAYAKPGTVGSLSGAMSSDGDTATVTFAAPTSEAPIDWYDVAVQYISADNLDPALSASYDAVEYPVMTTPTNSFTFTVEQLIEVLGKTPRPNSTFVLFRVKPHSAGGSAAYWSGGIYFKMSQFTSKAQSLAAAVNAALAKVIAAEASATTLNDTESANGINNATYAVNDLPESADKKILISRLATLKAQVTQRTLDLARTQVAQAEKTASAVDVELAKTVISYLGDTVETQSLLSRLSNVQIKVPVQTQPQPSPASRSIVCVSKSNKKVVKKITNSNPKCPVGFKQK